MLANEAEQQLRGLVEAVAGGCRRRAPTSRRCAISTAPIWIHRPSRAWGSKPLQPMLDAVRAARTHEDVAKLIGRPDMPMRTPIGEGVTIDAEESGPLHRRGDAERPRPAGARLLPEGRCRRFKDIRAKYQRAHRAHAHARRREECGRAGEVHPRAGNADREACTGRSRSAASAISRTTCARARSSTKLAPDFPWQAQLDAGRHRRLSKNSSCASSMPCRGWASCSARCRWRAGAAIMTYHLLAGAADVLPKAFDDERFDFYGRTLNGQPRAARALEARRRCAGRRARRSGRRSSTWRSTSRRNPRRRCSRWWRTCARPIASA